MEDKEKNFLRKIKIKLGRAEVEIVSEADELSQLKQVAEDIAQKIKTKEDNDLRYIG